MKAEQRKELETNTLADKVGRVMQRVKSSPRRTFMTYVIVGAAAVVVAGFAYHWVTTGRQETSEAWVRFYDGSGDEVRKLTKEKDSNVGKAALFQIAWIHYWDLGVKRIAVDKDAALRNIQDSATLYGQLADLCKDDSNSVFELQAMLGKAVATETLAVQDRSHLKRAQELYSDIVAKPDKENYAEVKFAQQRLAILKDKGSNAKLSGTYQELQDLLGVPAAKLQQAPGFGGKKIKDAP